MKKIIGIVFIILLSIQFAKAQQMPMFSQYMFSDYLINPAVAGTYDYYQIRTSHRFQWMGIQDPPITNTLGTYGPFQKQDMGWGAHMYSDVAGPSSKTGLYASYAFNFRISGDVRLSMGLCGGFFQYKIDGNKMDFEFNEIEPLNMIYTDYFPDASVGIYLYDIKKFSLGISAHQLINNEVQISEIQNDTSIIGKLKTHAMITGAYKISINGRLQVEPSFFVKSIEASNIQGEFTARIIYKKRYWFGGAYRTNNTLSGLIGFDYDNKIFMGYAVDFGFGNYAKISNGGTHELMLGFKFSPIFKPL